MSVSGGYINHMVGVPRNMSQTSFFGACPIGWGEGMGASYGHITLPFVGPICVSAVWLAAWNIQGPVKSDLIVSVQPPPPLPGCLYHRLTITNQPEKKTKKKKTARWHFLSVVHFSTFPEFSSGVSYISSLYLPLNNLDIWYLDYPWISVFLSSQITSRPRKDSRDQSFAWLSGPGFL